MRDLGFSVPWPPLNSYPSVTLIEGGKASGSGRGISLLRKTPGTMTNALTRDD